MRDLSLSIDTSQICLDCWVRIVPEKPVPMHMMMGITMPPTLAAFTYSANLLIAPSLERVGYLPEERGRPYKKMKVLEQLVFWGK